jgi:hypothetical protein
MSFEPPPPPGSPPPQGPKFVIPPPERPVASVESFRQKYVQGPQSAGTPPLLLPLVMIQVGLAIYMLYAWIPEELVVPGCPPIQGMYSLLVAFYVYKGKNFARLLAMIGAAAWALAAIIVMRSRTDLVDAIPSATRVVVMIRAVYEILFAIVLGRSDFVAFFEQRK